jgi:23S rRNA (cytidine1920-2'-O)/16S rRNA (cytidine1409-2'-O)-methyltransferase
MVDETQTSGERLDVALVSRGLIASRSRARDAILRGTVLVDGAVIRKPGLIIASATHISVNDPAAGYVSRSALKLIAALDHFSLSPNGCVALDIGASTGGFTQVLLERGAAHVIALDVGHRQMDPGLAADTRVMVIEGLNARDLTAGHLVGRAPEFLVCDVSFISLKLALPPALLLATPGAQGVFLIKPQFEAGRAAVGKGGLVDAVTAQATAQATREWLDGQPGWRTLGLMDSPIEGGDGNREFLVAAEKKS